jgi:hypothetical protein
MLAIEASRPGACRCGNGGNPETCPANELIAFWSPARSISAGAVIGAARRLNNTFLNGKTMDALAAAALELEAALNQWDEKR